MTSSRFMFVLGLLCLGGLLIWRSGSMPAVTIQAPDSSSSPQVTSTLAAPPATAPVSEKKTQTLSLENGRTLNLRLPTDYTVFVAAQGYKRLRFMAKSPDHRLFVGEMESAGDSPNGHVYVFDEFDPDTKTFKKVTPYLSKQRNPSSLAFYTDPVGQVWLYVALTDKLVRYKYASGDLAPSEPPQIVSVFPTYARPWSEGGGHITRTVIAHNNKIYVSVGSSCNSCEEKTDEPSRASILQMNPDGSDLKVFANGLRNAVGIQFLGNKLYATVNGSDNLGNDKPEDTFVEVEEGINYGWPYCYQLKGRIHTDTSQKWQRSFDCKTVPVAAYGFDPHSAPLGFDVSNGSFVVAVHGSGNKSLGVGYKLLTIDQNTLQASDLITGFLQDGQVHGRTAAVLTNDPHSFFVTDDYNGAIYYVSH